MTEQINGITITSENIDEAIRNIKELLNKPENQPDLSHASWLVPLPHWSLSKRYKGRGRPKKSDYDWIDIPAELKKIANK
jgi:hypothetical protein